MEGIGTSGDRYSQPMHFKLVCPSNSEVWDQPGNAGFRRDEVVRLLDGLRTRGHDYEIIDGDAINDEQRGELYGQAFSAVAHNGNRYRIRQVYGSRKHGGGEHLGKGVPALIVLENGEVLDVYPRQAGDTYETIHAYLAAL